MKYSILLFLALAGASCVIGRELRRTPSICVKGQSYWCQNITTAAECGAVKHCIQSVWEKERPIEVDRSEICQTCLDMVKQARDQLLSNQTQEEIKEVLEGTCKLIPIKILREECMKVMDQFGPELVDTLASEMDPQVVCSVAGLCDNNRVHRIEQQYNKQKSGKLDCGECMTAVNGVQRNFKTMKPDDFLNILFKMCNKLGSYSDGCFQIAVKEHKQMLKWLSRNLGPRPVCNVVGICRAESRHSVPVDAVPAVRVLNGKQTEDLPCELCEQLVQHLRDILVANTTEADFKLVLTGLCNQMTSYKDQCLGLVNEYYEIIYEFLVTELDGKVICEEIKLCPASQHSSQQFVRPLLPEDTEVEPEPIHLPITRFDPITYVPQSFLTNGGSNDQTLCSMCEFFLHFVQQEITLPSTEDKIKKVVEQGCSKLPSSVSDQCRTFIDTYMDEFIALLAQEIDPSLICPMLGVCPRGLVAVPYKDKPDCPLCLLAFQEVNSKLRNKNKTIDVINDVVDDLCVRDEFPNALSMECVAFITQNRRAIVDMVLTEFTPQESCAYIDLCIPSELGTKPKLNNPAGDINTNEIRENPDEVNADECVLCEFVITKLSTMLKDKKTEEEIKDAVFHVCDIMPKSVTPNCRQFIAQYADMVIELIIQEMDPKQICTEINLCPPSKTALAVNEGNENLAEANSEGCVLCEFIITKISTMLKDKKTEEEVKIAVLHVCDVMPKSVTPKCREFITEYADIVIELIVQEMDPKLICTEINLCPSAKALLQASMEKCLMCEVVMEALKTVLTDPEVDSDINVQLHRACQHVPDVLYESCLFFVQEVAPQVEVALRTLPVGPLVCRRIMYCQHSADVRTHAIPNKSNCKRGSAYWCISSAHAAMCNAIDYCQKEVWQGNKPRKSNLKGRVVISY